MKGISKETLNKLQNVLSDEGYGIGSCEFKNQITTSGNVSLLNIVLFELPKTGKVEENVSN